RDEIERQAKAAADAEARLKAAEAEQQRLKEEAGRQAQAAADAEAKRKAAEAEQQRLAAARAEEEKAKATAAAETQRKAEEAEQQRLAAAKLEEDRKAKLESEAARAALDRVPMVTPVLPGRPVSTVTGLFVVRSGAYTHGEQIDQSTLVSSAG